MLVGLSEASAFIKDHQMLKKIQHHINFNHSSMKYLFLVSVCTLSFLSAFAQSELPPQTNHASLNAGGSLTGILLSALLDGDSVKYSFTSAPALQLNYDRHFNKWFSAGLGFSIQNYTLNFDEFVDDNNILQTGDFKADLSRRHVHAKLLANKRPSENFEFYGGLRIGYLWYSSDISVEKRALKTFENFDKLLSIGRPTFGIPLGMRYYFVKNVGLNAELNLGAPHFLSAGLSCRF